MTTVTEFLLARIAEDEGEAHLFPIGPSDGLVEILNQWAERTRRDCEAKRRIVERCAWWTSHPRWRTDIELAFVFELVDGTLADLASVYADHPDYRDQWEP